MPIIRVDYDNEKVNATHATALCTAIQKIVQDATHIPTVFVYGRSAEIKVGAVEI